MILVIDSTNELLVGILDCENVLCFKYHAESREHVEKIAVICDALLRSVSIKPTDITEVIVSAGPGMYTGLRSGMAFAKTFAFVPHAKVTGVITLDVMAASVEQAKTPVLAVTDARRHEVFYALYDENGKLLIPHQVAKMETIAEAIKRVTDSQRLTIVHNLREEYLVPLTGVFDCKLVENPLKSSTILPYYYKVSRKYPNYDAPVYLRNPDVLTMTSLRT
ncbi:MAG: tRNA (adenosine(37)-N6)-threonylcarbamoyltransferase complex dimerization subunit type 1 TsaB [Bifidobacteriaceae bacterium]|jgi:tRNA threonylcarbamoyl adenosine modification protein YeaZ|nr:tRNA (adenosine(37)-N6)-threonylcarbamoyltransferase complex dimerization subunit type 1 TsaB [Bifidobacteriaceae bacterium]